MKFEKTEVMGFKGALRGMRNPMNSWNKSDSYYGYYQCNVCNHNHLCDKCITSDENNYAIEAPIIGENDMKLAKKLIKAGTEHRKFMRQIFVSVDITAPSYFMAEFDTYKIGTVRNSTSFMHKGVSKSFEIEDFEIDDERIIDILSTRKIKEKNDLYYPYETEEYKIYTTQNNRRYEIYKNGKVFSCPFSYTDTKGRTKSFEKYEVKPSIRKDGYWELNLGGREKEKWLLHRLIAFVWLDNTNHYETIDHKDNNKNDNSVENLEWTTRKENIKREFEDNLNRKDNIYANYKNWKISSKITPFDKLKIREMYQDGLNQKQISERYNISQSQVSVVLRNVKNTSDNYELFEECWIWEQILDTLNYLRERYLETKDYKYFRKIRQILPQSYLYTSTITMSYENIYTMVHQRKSHKLNEWSGQDNPELPNFISWARTLPYAQDLIFIDKTEDEAE